MSTPPSKHQRIKSACIELEMALQNFEDDSEARKNAERETKRIKEIKMCLSEIKKQLDDLSN